ncbi:MAG TPA: hypothetical protein ENI62_13735 [Gammaproteobacteria bacterium]|nr:hypothetical protein [Gammaproteobacteria bacterium]
MVPNLQQTARFSGYDGGCEVAGQRLSPDLFGIEVASNRATPLPVQAGNHLFDVDAMATAAARSGLAALEGVPGLSRESLVFTASLVLLHLGRATGSVDAAAQVRQVLDEGLALARFRG